MIRLFRLSWLAVGLAPGFAKAALPVAAEDTVGQTPQTQFDVFRLDHVYDLARHRSHSSHRSHRSHSSHRSSSGGGYALPRATPPATYDQNPVYSSPGSAQPAPLLGRPLTGSGESQGTAYAPSQPSATVLPGNTNKFQEIVRQVQTALYTYGYYGGAIDGLVGPKTRDAISKMQADYSLKVTGTITPEVLNALGVAAR